MPRKVKFVKERSNQVFSKEQRIQIVRDIENGLLTREEAMRKYNIVATNTLLSWMLRYAANPEKVLSRKISQAEKRTLAYRILNKETTPAEVAVEHGLGLHSIWGWVRNAKKEIQLHKNTPATALAQLKNEQREIEDLRLKVAALEMMIDIAQKELNIDIRKKSGTKQ
jgi:transposase